MTFTKIPYLFLVRPFTFVDQVMQKNNLHIRGSAQSHQELERAGVSCARMPPLWQCECRTLNNIVLPRKKNKKITSTATTEVKFMLYTFDNI